MRSIWGATMPACRLKERNIWASIMPGIRARPLGRHFCKHCASNLWCYDSRWPDLVHPFASAIDTALPVPPEHVNLMTAYKAPWCEIEAGPQDKTFDEYPDESLAQWHQRLGLTR